MKPSTTILTKTKITKNTTYDILMKYVIRKTENRRNILRRLDGQQVTHQIYTSPFQWDTFGYKLLFGKKKNQMFWLEHLNIFLYFCIHIQNFSSQEGDWFKLKMANASPLKSEGPLSLIYVYATFNIEKKKRQRSRVR